jgi:hypothetical protein
MSTREKILVGLMIVSVCLGVWLLLGDRQKESPLTADSGEPDTLISMLTNLTAQFGNDSTLAGDRYTLSMALTPWPETLFLEDENLLPQAASASADNGAMPSNVPLVYSGYIETAQRRVAIINGIEYIVGEMVDQSLLVVRHIDPKRVVLGASAHKTFSIPLADEWESQAP